jgi:hypothetical protein
LTVAADVDPEVGPARLIVAECPMELTVELDVSRV